MMAADAPEVVLASGSAARAEMLGRAGLAVRRHPAAVDEAEIKASCRAAGMEAGEVAEALAELKAMRVSPRYPGALVIGADQMLDCEGRWFDKPEDPDAARAQLAALSGRTHRLVTCAVVVRDGQRLWHHLDAAELTMRTLSPGFVDRYLAEAGEAVLTTVGAYQLEGLGAQLFSRVRGDFFTILGLPLLPLLGFLRVHGAVPS
jgi:septum formation protein